MPSLDANQSEQPQKVEQFAAPGPKVEPEKTVKKPRILLAEDNEINCPAGVPTIGAHGL